MLMPSLSTVVQVVEMAGKRHNFDAVTTHVATYRHHVDVLLQTIEQLLNDNRARKFLKPPSRVEDIVSSR